MPFTRASPTGPGYAVGGGLNVPEILRFVRIIYRVSFLTSAEELSASFKTKPPFQDWTKCLDGEEIAPVCLGS